MEAVSEQRLIVCFPPLAIATRAADNALIRATGNGIRVAQCDRSIAESDADYAQGRTKPGKVISNAPGLHSWHNYRMAVDVYPFVHGDAGPLDWNPMDAEFLAMDAAMKAQDLAAGREWHCLKDYPHYQPANLPVSPTADDIAAFERGGYPAVWERYTI